MMRYAVTRGKTIIGHSQRPYVTFRQSLRSSPKGDDTTYYYLLLLTITHYYLLLLTITYILLLYDDNGFIMLTMVGAGILLFYTDSRVKLIVFGIRGIQREDHKTIRP